VTAAFPRRRSTTRRWRIRRTHRDMPGPRPTLPCTPGSRDIAAGSAGAYSVQPGLCVRIMTGAPSRSVPTASYRWSDRRRYRAGRHPAAAAAGAHIRRAGEDTAAGDRASRRHPSRRDPDRVARAAVATASPHGRALVSWCCRPGVELGPGDATVAGKIPDANSTLLDDGSARRPGASRSGSALWPDDPRQLLGHVGDQLIARM